jgi:hypothetical protein
MSATFSGPLFDPCEDEDRKSSFGKSGGHYNIYAAKDGRGLDMLKRWFPDAKANEFNFVLFSTSGVHGTYTTIEQIEIGIAKYGINPDFGEEGWPDDYHGNELTFLLIQPRIVGMTYGTLAVCSQTDVDYLKTLRASSWEIVQQIGRQEDEDEL